MERYFAIAGPEVTYGEVSTLDLKKIRVTGMSDAINRNLSVEEACDISAPTNIAPGTYKVSGTIDMLYRKGATARLMTSLLGSSAGMTLEPAMDSYNFIVGDDQGGKSINYTGCAVNTMEITCAVKEFVKVRYGWIGSKAIVGTIAGPTTWEGGDPDTADKPSVTYNSLLTFPTTAPLKVKSLTLSVNRALDEDNYYIGSPLLQGIIPNKVSEITGTMTLSALDFTTLKGAIIGSATNNITAPNPGSIATSSHDQSKNEVMQGELKIILGDKAGSSGGASITNVTITLANVMLSESTHSVTGRNQWEKTVNYRAAVSSTADFTIA